MSRRLQRFDWPAVGQAITDVGHARLEGLLTAHECAELMRLWDHPDRFRSSIDMERHRFGRGEYRYFAEPLPRLVGDLRAALYRRLAPIANRLHARLGLPATFPTILRDYRAVCAAKGQSKPTPLLLRYAEGGYNRLHRDVYGSELFPFQVVVALTRPGVDHTGGEFLLVEQHPRQQSIGHAVVLGAGDGLVFPVRYRSVEGARGPVRVDVRHGVSRLLSGGRTTLGIIFHDAA